MKGFSFSLTDATPPASAVEISAHRVSAVTVELRGRRPSITAHGSEMLPEGAVVPGLAGGNIKDRPAVVAAVRQVLDRVGSPRRVGLVIPDPVAKVSLVRFSQVPSKRQDLEQVIRWQVRKAAPFPIEEAQVAYAAGSRIGEEQEFLVSVARRDVIAEYESLCADAGAHAGLVDLSTFNVINVVLAGAGLPSGDWLLVNVSADWTSIVILRGADVIFFRNRSADGEGTLADLVHQTAMYYEDRLSGSGFSRVMLSGGSSVSPRQSTDVDQLRQSLEERLGTVVDSVDLRKAATLDDASGGAQRAMDALAPLVGLLVRDRQAA